MRGAWRLRKLVGLPAPIVIPPNPASVPDSAYSPHLHFATAEHEVSKRLAEYVRKNRSGTFLDVGGGTGAAGHYLAAGYDYTILDLEPQTPDGLYGDICDCPQIASESYDIVFSNNTYEHLKEPWLAAQETGRLLKPGGMAAVVTCFSWRYHPVPGDYFRFSHTALEFLFEKYAGLETVTSGYDLRQRRADMQGGKLAGNLDGAPTDELGGFRENWEVFYVGRKPSRA